MISFWGYEVTASISRLGGKIQFWHVFPLKAGEDDGCTALKVTTITVDANRQGFPLVNAVSQYSLTHKQALLSLLMMILLIFVCQWWCAKSSREKHFILYHGA